MYNMAAAMRKVHIGIKNRIFICLLSVLTLKMETIGGRKFVPIAVGLTVRKAKKLHLHFI